MKLSFKITGQSIEAGKVKIVENTVDYIDASFLFDSEWNGLAKEVYFSKGETTYKIPLINDKIERDAHLNLSSGSWRVACYGLQTDGTMVISTDPCLVHVAPTLNRDGVIPPETPSSEIDLILQKSQNAENLANEVKGKADRGEFDGLSAYEVAVKNGYEGTESQWLDSLRYDHSEEFTILAEKVRADVVKSETARTMAEESATQSSQMASASEVSADKSAQAYSDLLATIGTSVAELVGGKIPMSQIPATATTEIYEVASKEELTSLIAQKGDLAELVEIVNGERTITKTWQLLGTDSTILDNWVVWGTSYAVQSGSSTIAGTSNDSERINGMRFVTMNYSDFETAVKDENTLYAVDMQR